MDFIKIQITLLTLDMFNISVVVYAKYLILKFKYMAQSLESPLYG